MDSIAYEGIIHPPPIITLRILVYIEKLNFPRPGDSIVEELLLLFILHKCMFNYINTCSNFPAPPPFLVELALQVLQISEPNFWCYKLPSYSRNGRVFGCCFLNVKLYPTVWIQWNWHFDKTHFCFPSRSKICSRSLNKFLKWFWVCADYWRKQRVKERKSHCASWDLLEFFQVSQSNESVLIYITMYLYI